MTPTSTVPAISLPALNRAVLLVSRPAGIPQPGDFRIEDRPVPQVGEGQFLVRNIYLSVDPAQRGWAAAASNYSDAVPLGTPMRALAVGMVIESRDPEIKAGEYLYGWFGWQDYCLATRKSILRRVDPARAPLAAYAGVLGINGLTAYLALTNLGAPRAGETVLVSTAAGAVGSIVGQLARSMACRTVGLTGSEQKVERCRTRYGYDVALNYKAIDLGSELGKVCPNGIDVFFDNAGGDILDAAVRHMAVRGRVIQCGTAAIASWLPAPTGLRNEREVLTKRLCWRGFIIFDHAERYEEAGEVLSKLLAEKRLAYDEDILQDIADAPGAIASLYAGENTGKKLIFIAG